MPNIEPPWIAIQYQIMADKAGEVWINLRNVMVVIENGNLLNYHGGLLIAKAGKWRIKPEIPKHFVVVKG